MGALLNLKPPTTEIGAFRLARRAWSDDEVTLVLGAESYRLDLAELRQWFTNIGWRSQHAPAEKLIDLLWNLRVLDCDRATCTFRIPEVQVHPDDLGRARTPIVLRAHDPWAGYMHRPFYAKRGGL